MDPFVSIIIVTHNSQTELNRCIEALDCQSAKPGQLVVVDSGSDDISYLQFLADRDDCSLLTFENIGYGAGNNRGLQVVDSRCDYVLIINPDTFLSKTAIEDALRVLRSMPEVALLTGLLEGYDLQGSGPTGKIDSSGVFRTWYGRWYDRGMGTRVTDGNYRPGYIPAVCGAFMFCRLSVVSSEMPEFFDESFFMYKEDIELCIRLSGKGWKFYFSPDVRAYHCRGWGHSRRSISRTSKLLSAENEVRIYRKHPSIYAAWAGLKYFLVRYLNI